MLDNEACFIKNNNTELLINCNCMGGAWPNREWYRQQGGRYLTVNV